MMQHYSRSKRRYGRKKRGTAVLRAMAAGSQIVNISRWQRAGGVAEDGSTPLKYFLYNQTPIGSAGDNRFYYPIHVYPLTEYLGNNTVRTLWGANGVRGDTTEYGYYPILSAQNDGALSTTNWWKPERGPHNPTSKAFHAWTDIKLRLFGAYGYPIVFHVWLCQIPDESACPGYATNSNEKVTEMYNWLTRSMCSSSMAGGTSGTPNPMKILKRYRYTTDSFDKADEAAAIGSTIAITKEANYKDVRIFVRHDRMRDYTWRYTTNPVPTNANTNGWDTTDGTNVSKEPDIQPSKRLFMYVMAEVAVSSAPLAGSVDTVVNNTTPSTHILLERRFQPAYDIVMRNKFITTS